MEKKPTRANIEYLFRFGTQQPGRGPKKPETAEAALDQLVQDSNAWVRRCVEAWFCPTNPIIEEAVASGGPRDLAGKYDEAIYAIQVVAGCAELAEQKLKKGKRKVQARLRRAKS